MEVGLIGKANVGKSTFFAAATQAPAATGNFPFTTVKPNVGVAHARAECPCSSIGSIEGGCGSCEGGTRLIPVGLVDVAGLVPGAHEGRGMGNRFLDDARRAAALIHVVDASGGTDEQGRPCAPGSRDPREDVGFVMDEFDRWFAAILSRELPALSKDVSQKREPAAAAIARRFSGLGAAEADVRAALEAAGLDGRPPGSWAAEDALAAGRALRRECRPVVVAANKADACPGGAAAAAGVAEGAVPCSAEVELMLRRAAAAGLVSYEPGAPSFEVTGELSPDQRAALDRAAALLEEAGSTGVQAAVDGAVFGALGMFAAYPVEDEARLSGRDGRVLPDAVLLRPGSTARDLAAAVHADLAAGFLHAVDCRTRQRIGADHELGGGDVVRIVSTLSRG